MTLPIKHVHTLSLENCNKLSSQSLFTILVSASGVRHLNIKGCEGVDDQLFKDLNPTVHLKSLNSIAFGGNISAFGVKHLVKKFPRLSAVEISGANLTSVLCATLLRLGHLLELTISYSHSESLTEGFTCNSKVLRKVCIFPSQNISVSPHVLHLFDALTNCPLVSVSTNLPPQHLSILLPHWPNLRDLTTCELGLLPESVARLCLYTDGHDLLESLKHSDERFLKNLKELKLKLNCEWYMEGIKEQMREHYPLCKVKCEMIR